MLLRTEKFSFDLEVLPVVKIIVLDFFKLCISTQTSLRDTGSIPVVGSSKKITFGLPIALIATESLRFIPPE